MQNGEAVWRNFAKFGKADAVGNRTTKESAAEELDPKRPDLFAA